MIGVRTEASMDYFETDSNSSAPKRVPLSLRLPVQGSNLWIGMRAKIG